MKNKLRVLLAEKGARENRNLTIKKLAEEVNIDVNTLTRFANNKLKQIPVEVINIVCNYFDCEVGDLLQREKEVGPKRLPRKKDEF